MRDQIYCYSDVLSPNVIYVGATPPVEEADRYEREWALNVFDPDLTMRALRRRLKGRAHGMQRDRYRCSPMEARGMAVELTTLRQKDPRYVPPSADERNLALLLAIALTLSVIVTQSVRLETAATISLTGTVLCGVVAIYSIIRARRFRQYG